ncbi:MAG TPA: rhodanese-like domain-containing protein [Actinomycetes bacterium]|nr:rhodanese-like domain-containing protein [Actinomycetes bacterium]
MEPSSTAAQDEEVDPRAASALVDQGAMLVDVREPQEWAAGRAPGAVHLPMRSLPLGFTDLPADRPLLIVCRSGSRSAVAAAFLRRTGRDARNVTGGLRAWVRSGLPLVDDQGEPGTVI